MPSGGRGRPGATGQKPGRRPYLICARRDAATCGRDSPAPSIQLRPRPANLGRPAFPSAPAAPFGADHDVGRTPHPKTERVVTVVRSVVVTSGGARKGILIVPGTTAHHPGQVSGNPTELHSASRVWRRTAAVASKKIARCCAARSEAFSLIANPCPYWVSDGGRNFLPQFRACFPAFNDRLCIGDELSPRPKFSGRQTLNIHSNNHLGVSVYGKIILSIDS